MVSLRYNLLIQGIFDLDDASFFLSYEYKIGMSLKRALFFQLNCSNVVDVFLGFSITFDNISPRVDDGYTDRQHPHQTVTMDLLQHLPPDLLLSQCPPRESQPSPSEQHRDRLCQSFPDDR